MLSLRIQSRDITCLLYTSVGHVNKDGAIAGPKVMEHIVDTVLYFEGDKMLPYRILRAAKNRYGSTNELGMFDMTGQGLSLIHIFDGLITNFHLPESTLIMLVSALYGYEKTMAAMQCKKY